MSRITRTTERVIENKGKLLIPYFVAGDPNLRTTLQLMHAVVDQGADIIELGIPFSCLLYTSPSPRDYAASRMPSSA